MDIALNSPYDIASEPSYQGTDNVLVLEKEQFDTQRQRNYSMWVKKLDKTSMKFLTVRLAVFDGGTHSKSLLC